jgi:hypothetical protein
VRSSRFSVAVITLLVVLALPSEITKAHNQWACGSGIPVDSTIHLRVSPGTSVAAGTAVTLTASIREHVDSLVVEDRTLDRAYSLPDRVFLGNRPGMVRGCGVSFSSAPRCTGRVSLSAGRVRFLDAGARGRNGFSTGKLTQEFYAQASALCTANSPIIKVTWHR